MKSECGGVVRVLISGEILTLVGEDIKRLVGSELYEGDV